MRASVIVSADASNLDPPVVVVVLTMPAVAEPYSAPKPPAWYDTSSKLRLGTLPDRLSVYELLTNTPST